MDDSYNYYYNDLDLTMRVTWVLGKKVICCRTPAIPHRDKAVTFRPAGAGAGDLDLFKACWAERAGIPPDHVACHRVLLEADVNAWYERGEFKSAL